MSFSCHKCNSKITGTNCAYELSFRFGVKAKVVSHSWCKCRYPIRAKEVRDYYYDGYLDDDEDDTENKFIYWETSKGTGHVYFGTYSKCKIGNNLPASKLSSCVKFHRYEYFDGHWASDY